MLYLAKRVKGCGPLAVVNGKSTTPPGGGPPLQVDRAANGAPSRWAAAWAVIPPLGTGAPLKCK